MFPIIRTAVLALAALGTAALSLAAPAAQASVTPTATCTATVCRIVVYEGGGNKVPVGPAGPLTSAWTVYPQLKKITTTNDGTMAEDLTAGPFGTCAKDCGEWWYHTGGVFLNVFYWNQPGGAGKVKQNYLQSLTNDSAAWINLGNGVWTPKCLEWIHAPGVIYFIGLNIHTYTWSKLAGTDPVQECNALPN